MKSLALVAAVLALLAPPAQAQDVLTETRVTQFGAWQDTASATLTIDGSTDTEVFAPILEAFAKRVPDVAIRYREITTNELYQLAESGCSGNAPAADLVVSSSIDQQVKLANDGCAQPNHSAQVQALAGLGQVARRGGGPDLRAGGHRLQSRPGAGRRRCRTRAST